MACFCVALLAIAQTLPPLLPPAANFSFPAKQTLTYAVDWRVFPAGTATFHLEQVGGMQHVVATGESIGAVNLLFRVNDRFESYFNRTTGCSTSFAKQLQEGRRQLVSTLRFLSSEGKQVLEEKNLVTGTSKHQESPIPPCVTDLMSAIFYGGSQTLQPGGMFHMPVADAMRVVDVTMKAEAKEQVVTLAGTFQTIRVQPIADAGVVKNRGNIWIWYTDDDRHMPVQMRARLFWGTITMRLVSMARSKPTGCDSVRASTAAVGLVDDVVGQLFIGKHGQRGPLAVGYHLRGLIDGKAPILADHRHHHVHHHLQAADLALFLHFFLRGLGGLDQN